MSPPATRYRSTSHRATPVAVLVATVLASLAVLTWVDLSPQVESEFFFAEDDPQLQVTREIDRRFPTSSQVVVRAAAPDLDSPEYRAGVAGVTERLAAIPAVRNVYSIATDDPSRSPLWRRLLLTPDSAATNLIVTVDDTAPERLLPELEEALSRSGDTGIDLELSGVPVIVERIRRSLFRDLIVFSSAALVLFAVITTLVYRRAVVVVGTLCAALLACSITLLLNRVLDIQIGLLTANIVTIVFVLTLSHIVFLTSNWRAALRAGDPDPARTAASRTLQPSLWCMVTTLLGFLSLLIASARPLRELGMAGALGTGVALIVVFATYPAFLRVAHKPASGAGTGGSPARFLPWTRRRAWLAGLAAIVLILGTGVPRVNTDPGLLSYFSRSGDIRPGLEAIDRDGGSSMLRLVIRDANARRMDDPAVYERLWVLQDALEAQPEVGVVVSPAVLLEHARLQPFAGFLSLGDLLDLLEEPALGGVGLGFVTQDRMEAQYLIRMREGQRLEPREAIIARLLTAVRDSGLEPVLAGGTYDLQAQLGRLISSSLKIGLGGLLSLFAVIAIVVARRVGVAFRMLLCLIGIPAIVLGTFGHAGLPVDMITSPAANVALAMGVDSMIHLVTRARLLGLDRHPTPWRLARAQMAGPILAATLIICAGFGIFALSTFPPTRRFGLAVILGTLAAASMALIGLPLAARRTPPGPTSAAP